MKLGKSRGFTLIEMMIVVAIIAILAVVATPAYTKYMRDAKTAEATQMIDLIKKGAVAYYTIPRTHAGGEKVPCQFPAANPLTPAAGTCCDDANDSDNDERCDARPDLWHTQSWSALKFRISEQHYYQYQFESGGQLSGAWFVASAYGDLDCDTTRSTFQMHVGGDPNATSSECDTVMTSGYFRASETE